ncbi:MAG: peptide ABC transporter substrate-binding protein [Oscillospiraceae bacterium]|nr:peptide ABC transporter substrate-binding protein [Oscillospiraceae bacterium]
MKRLLPLLLAVVMALGLAACGGGSTSGGTDANNASPGTSSGTKDFVVAMQADATSMDPHIGSNGDSNQVLNEMYECLLTFDKDTNVIPLLAKSWEVSEDGRTYTFQLNEDITFHDGEPFTAEAVRATFERGINDQTLSLYRTVKDWEDVRVESDYEVAIILKEPNNTFINKITQTRIVSPKALARDDVGDYLSKNSAGTGPYILSGRVDGGYTKMIRNENYWQEGPKVDTLTFKVVPEDGSRLAMLQTGEAHVAIPVPLTDTTAIESDPNLILDVVPGITYRYVTLNTEWTLPDGRKPFADKRIRQALNYAFDSEAYAKVVFSGYAVEPTSIFSTAILYHAPQTPYKADLEKAKSLMEEAGFGDGFEVNIIVDNTSVEQKGATFVMQQLSQIGVTVNLLPNESTANAELTSAPLENTTVQMWYVNWGSGSYEADGSMRSILHGDKFPPEGYNTAFWNNAQFNQLLDDALKMSDTDEIAAAYAEAQAIAWEECPWIFLGNDNSVNAYRSNVTGLLYKPAGTYVFRTVGLE